MTSDHSIVEDCVQIAWLRFWNKPTTYDPQKKFEFYIFAIAKNQLIDEVRKRERSPIQAEFLDNQFVERRQENKQSSNLNKLPKAVDRDCADLYCRHERGTTFEELGKEIGLSADTTRKRVSRFKKKHGLD